MYLLHGHLHRIPYLRLVSDCIAVCPQKTHLSYGFHVLNHLTTDGTGLAGSQIAVVALAQVYTNLP